MQKRDTTFNPQKKKGRYLNRDLRLASLVMKLNILIYHYLVF